MEYSKKAWLDSKLDNLTPSFFDPKQLQGILKTVRELFQDLNDRVDKLETQLKQTGHKGM